MALINCPECNKEISDKAEFCINCGYKLPQPKPTFQGVYCPRCLKSSLKLNGQENICSFCHVKEVDSIIGTIKEIYDYDKNHPELKQSPEFNEEAYQYRINYIPGDYGNNSGTKCPYCHSTNTKKISGTGRWLSTGIFGLASGKIGKQWHCNSCKSDF